MTMALLRRFVVFAALPLFCTAAAAVAPPRPALPFAIQARSSALWKRIAPGTRPVVLAQGFGFTEGPVWDRRGFLYVSDELQNKIYRVAEDGSKQTLVALGDPDGNTYDERGRLLDCASVLRAVIRLRPDGHYTVLADRYQGRRLNTPNDIVLGPDGAYYFTDPTLDFTKGMVQEIPFQGVYRLGRDGRLRLLVKDMSQPNGLAFSPDGRRLYVDDTQQRNIRVFDFHAGRVSHERVFAREPLLPGGPGGVPDGMRVDEGGDLFVTGPGGIWVWDAAGHHLGTIQFPHGATNFSWGGRDYRTLYIAAGDTIYTLRTRVRGFVPYPH